MLKRRTAVSFCCDTGDVRPINQDHVFVRHGEIMGYQVGLFAVADGCGGMSHGEKISRLLADSLCVIWEQMIPGFLRSASNPVQEMMPALMTWIRQINSEAYAYGLRIGEKVGSTLTLLATLDRHYFILNAGDSRAYLSRGGNLTQLTQDQSLVADMLRNREITPEQAKVFGQRNVLTMCVGYFEQVQLFQAQGKLRKGDVFLLCSDGLYRSVEEEMICDSISRRVQRGSAYVLRDLIPAGAARDNVSIVLVEIF